MELEEHLLTLWLNQVAAVEQVIRLQAAVLEVLVVEEMEVQEHLHFRMLRLEEQILAEAAEAVVKRTLATLLLFQGRLH